MKLPLFLFVGNPINKNKVPIAWKGYHNVIYFSIIFTSVYTLPITNLDIFRLAYILSHSIGQELVRIDPFLASVPVLYPLKRPGNQKASGVFRGYKIRAMARNGLIKFIIPR